jgi:hypothetical protein
MSGNAHNRNLKHIVGAGYQWYNRSVLEDALQRSSIQGSDQADVDGLTEGVIA